MGLTRARVAPLVVVAALLFGTGPDAPVLDAEQTPRRVACVRQAPAGQVDDRYCARLAHDLARRQPLEPSQRAHAETVSRSIRLALASDALDHCNREPVSCPRFLEQARQAPTADEVARRLAGVGYRGVTVRVAGAGDPAPLGAVLHAVRAGPACVIGYQLTREAVLGQYAAGTLPDGSCLAE